MKLLPAALAAMNTLLASARRNRIPEFFAKSLSESAFGMQRPVRFDSMKPCRLPTTAAFWL